MQRLAGGMRLAFLKGGATRDDLKVFPFEQAREAYGHCESGAHFGKVCIAM
jgi:hypothetical protein